MVILAQIVILILAISVQGLVGSTNNTNAMTTNMALRYDLQSRTDLAVQQAMANFLSPTGLLGDPNLLTAHQAAANYSPVMLPTDINGIPLDLLNLQLGSTLYTSPSITDASAGFKMNYIIERLCNIAGAPQSTQCLNPKSSISNLGGTSNTQPLPPPFYPLYRISVKVESLTDQLKTQQFIQVVING